MADENTDDLCKDCSPTFTAFLEGMAEQNKFIPNVGEVVGGIAKGAVGNVVGGTDVATQAPVQAVGGLLGRKKK